jgi:Ca2+-dependent lipid-binding protein
LRNLDKKTVSDPYARVYLLPDEKPGFKRKTRIIKNNLNPVWQETFDYPMSLQAAQSKHLLVNLKDERGLFERQSSVFLGEVVLSLKNIPDLTSPHTRWFYLQPSKLQNSKK